MLTDMVSRGGNLLLDIGPAADGTIPVIMEERLLQIGDWLKVNGDAIYGTKPWKTTRQWSAGELPKIDYNQEFNAGYDVAKLTEPAAPAKPPSRPSSPPKATMFSPFCRAGRAARSASAISARPEMGVAARLAEPHPLEVRRRTDHHRDA